MCVGNDDDDDVPRSAGIDVKLQNLPMQCIRVDIFAIHQILSQDEEEEKEVAEGDKEIGHDCIRDLS